MSELAAVLALFMLAGLSGVYAASLKPLPRRGESAAILERRLLSREWALHACVGLVFLSGLILLPAVVLPEARQVGGLIVGIAASAVAFAVSPPPAAPARFDRWFTKQRFLISMAAHAALGAAASAAIVEPVYR